MTTPKIKINIVTLGCSKNLVDSEVLMRQLDANGIIVEHDSDSTDADIVIINTCGFIDDAKDESIDTILEFVKAKEAGIIDKIYVMGCLSERYKDSLKDEIPDVDQYFGVNDLQEIITSISNDLLLSKGTTIDFKKELLGERLLTTPTHFAYMKVSEGCDKSCSFCVIPKIRGPHISRPIESIVNEATNLVGGGTKEILLIAQDLSYYGFDLYNKYKLPELLDKLSNINGLEWIRLHYAYPTHFPLGIIDVMKEKENICNYIDIPFQHSSDKMLKIMRRGHTGDQAKKLIDTFRSKIPDIAIRTTFLVGHPGETEKDFENLKNFVKQCRFERFGVFSFSNEEDTYSYKNYTDDIPAHVKQERVDELINIQQEISLELNTNKIGKNLKILIDRIEGDNFIGRTEHDSPEVDNEVIIPTNGKNLKVGEFYNVKITDAVDYDLFGVVE